MTSTALDQIAPDAAAAIHDLVAAAWAALDPDRVDLLARVCAAQHGLDPLERPAGQLAASGGSLDWRERSDLDDSQRAALAFAEQFVIDVSAIGDEQRRSLGSQFGAGAGDLAFEIYVLDMVPRVRFALQRLLGAGIRGGADDVHAAPGESDAPAPMLWPSIETFIRVVAQLDSLDPVTSELVRLRGARQHHCRMCASLRNRSALLAGADDVMFDAVDSYDAAGSTVLSARHVAALALVDAMIWTPAQLDDELVAELRRQFCESELVELVLDVMRNAANKIAVSLAADGANVDEGYEIYDIGTDGEPVYGLSLS